jgi:hypothetical protein
MQALALLVPSAKDDAVHRSVAFHLDGGAALQPTLRVQAAVPLYPFVQGLVGGARGFGSIFFPFDCQHFSAL